MLSGERSQNNNLKEQELKKQFLYSCKIHTIDKIYYTLSTSLQAIQMVGWMLTQLKHNGRFDSAETMEGLSQLKQRKDSGEA